MMMMMIMMSTDEEKKHKMWLWRKAGSWHSLSPIRAPIRVHWLLLLFDFLGHNLIWNNFFFSFWAMTECSYDQRASCVSGTCQHKTLTQWKMFNIQYYFQSLDCLVRCKECFTLPTLTLFFCRLYELSVTPLIPDSFMLVLSSFHFQSAGFPPISLYLLQLSHVMKGHFLLCCF